MRTKSHVPKGGLLEGGLLQKPTSKREAYKREREREGGGLIERGAELFI